MLTNTMLMQHHIIKLAVLRTMQTINKGTQDRLSSHKIQRLWTKSFSLLSCISMNIFLNNASSQKPWTVPCFKAEANGRKSLLFPCFAARALPWFVDWLIDFRHNLERHHRNYHQDHLDTPHVHHVLFFFIKLAFIIY